MGSLGAVNSCTEKVNPAQGRRHKKKSKYYETLFDKIRRKKNLKKIDRLRRIERKKRL